MTTIQNIELTQKDKHIVYCGIAWKIIIISAIITNIIYSTMALLDTSHKNLQNQCNKTNLWIYLIVILTMSPINIRRLIKLYIDDTPNISLITFNTLIQSCILCWGVYELWIVSCVNNIKSNDIYYMTKINVFADCIITLIILTTISLTA